MSCWRLFLAWFLVTTLIGCGATDEHLRSPDAQALGIEPDASSEELYFELVRLHSAGLMGSERMESIQDNLDWLDTQYGDTTEFEEQERRFLASVLRRTLRELYQEQNPVAIASEGRAYAWRLHRAGVREARRYAENTLLIAGMMGVPTSEDDMILMVALPVGGYVVVKAGGMALERAVFMLRRLRSVDDVVDRARILGLQPRYAASEAELRDVAGDKAAEAMRRAETHVGARGDSPEGKYNPWNPTERRDNCTACVTSVIRNSMEGYFKHSADDIERLFGYTGRERRFNPESSLRYIEEATGLEASSKPVSMIASRAPVGHYVVFTRWSAGAYHHVVYGRVTPTGRVIIFDPQSMEHMSYEQMLKRHGRALPYLLEAR